MDEIERAARKSGVIRAEKKKQVKKAVANRKPKNPKITDGAMSANIALSKNLLSPQNYRAIERMSRETGISESILKYTYFALNGMTINQCAYLLGYTEAKVKKLVTVEVQGQQVVQRARLDTFWAFRNYDKDGKIIQGTGVLMVHLNGNFWNYLEFWLSKRR